MGQRVQSTSDRPPSVHQLFYRIERHHWWFVARRRIVLALLRRELECDSLVNARQLMVCDVGTGCGATLQKLGERYDAVGMDISAEAVEFARHRGCRVERGALPDKIPFRSGSFDAVLALDVLEHVDEDRAATRALASLLKPGGVLLATVPAYPWLWTKRDDYHGHKRRYTRRSFLRVLSEAGLDVRVLTYFNTFLFPLALLDRIAKRSLRLDRTEADISMPPRFINSLMAAAFAFERFLIPRMRLPYGLSIVAVCRKRGQ